MTGLRKIAKQAGLNRLFVAGTAPVTTQDGLPPWVKSVVLLGPDEPQFWDHFTTTAEFNDGQDNAMDRWSQRVVTQLATYSGGAAFFPFGGAPYWPFLSWAVRSGRCWSSPVGLLVHDTAGLFVSFRGAIGLAEALPADTGSAPCDTCIDQPCKAACPAKALTPAGYDVPACKSWLETGAGAVCHTGGCLVRRSCPVGADRRLPAQSAYHMKAFHPT